MSNERSVTEFTPAELLDGLARIYGGLRERNAYLEHENRRLKSLVGKLESEHARLVSARVGSENEFNAIVSGWWRDEHLRQRVAELPESPRCEDGEMHHDVPYFTAEHPVWDSMLCLWCGRIRPLTTDEIEERKRWRAEQEERDAQRREKLLVRMRSEGGGCPTSGG